ncbi:hypothetical protein [Halomicronema sp. CCY15110]|uniref:hypothetical protein n=1 Tax=Halomicronema sp. CCY15110 TaxID=2767773 RepID=UPI00194EC430|nr:hypothetical protein [Halomicronema sp. CCY15110]
MSADALTWPLEAICLAPSKRDVLEIALDIYDRTCRTGFDAPGFCLVNIAEAMDSGAFRQLMVDLKTAMATIHAGKTERTLIYLSAGRFDQQETTRPHLDGGPDECFLMLGYEPSEVDAQLEIFDYAKCAFDIDLTPKAFMAQHNPMFQPGYELLRPYSMRLPCFDRSAYQIICINNSSAPFSVNEPKWQGTLHTATILTPGSSRRRVINSTMIAPAPISTPDRISESQPQDFLTTATVRRRGDE